MPYLLNSVYLLLLTLAFPWLLWSAIRKGKYREGYAEKLLGLAPRRIGQAPCLWLHAVSVGEVNLLVPLVERLRQRCPAAEIVISTTTRTGRETAQRRFPELTVFYAPLDFSWAVRAALARVRPDVLVLAELEIWPNLIREAHQVGTYLAIVNGRLSDRSTRGYSRIQPLVRSLLARIDVIAVQTEEYARRFRMLGARPESVHVTGSIKFDGARTCRENPKTRQLAALAGLSTGDIVFLAGSTQAPEEQLCVDAYRVLRDRFPALRLILVPRHPERFSEVAAMLDRSGLPWQRRSQLQSNVHSHATAAASERVLLVDAMGELSAWWGAARIGYVGGSMGKRGGQSMIEPAGYGVAVAFGPHTHNFRDIVKLMLQQAAAVVVQDGQQLTAFVEQCLSDPDYCERLGEHAQQLVLSQFGAADRTVELLSHFLPEQVPQREAA